MFHSFQQHFFEFVTAPLNRGKGAFITNRCPENGREDMIMIVSKTFVQKFQLLYNKIILFLVPIQLS